ncbi:hypothetical protein HK096_010501, partial [Nowakowskiella sp. JEL0078]
MLPIEEKNGQQIFTSPSDHHFSTKISPPNLQIKKYFVLFHFGLLVFLFQLYQSLQALDRAVCMGIGLSAIFFATGICAGIIEIVGLFILKSRTSKPYIEFITELVVKFYFGGKAVVEDVVFAFSFLRDGFLSLGSGFFWIETLVGIPGEVSFVVKRDLVVIV